jgi:hypothetical protein
LIEEEILFKVADMRENSKSEIEEKLRLNDMGEVANALLYATFNINDFDWVQDLILRMLDHPDEDVCGLAITCLGHTARIYSKIDKEKVVPKLELKVKNERFAGRVQDALDDIEMFASD